MTRSRIGRSSIGRFTAERAIPLSWSMVAGIPSPTACTAGPRRAGLADLANEQVHQLALGPTGRRLTAFPGDLRACIEDAEKHLRAAQIHPDRFGRAHSWGQATAGIGMISNPFMPRDDEQQPSGPPDYKVYRSRKGRLRGLRKPELSNLREQERAAPEGPRRRWRLPRWRRRPASPGTLGGPGTAGPQMGRDWPLSAGSCSASSPSRSQPSCRHSSCRATQSRRSTATRCCCPRPRRSSSSAPTLGLRTRRNRVRRPRRNASTSRPTATPRTATARSASSAPTR